MMEVSEDRNQDWSIFFETIPLSSLGEVFLDLSNFIPQGHSGLCQKISAYKNVLTLHH